MPYFMRKLYLYPGDDAGGGTPPADPPKTFTQEEVSRMMAEEKRQGRASVLKDLGVDDEASAKAALESYRKSIEDNKTELQKAQELLDAEKKSKIDLETQATALQNKLDALKQGVKPDYLDDALAIAKTKVTDKEDLDKVLAGMKERYPMFFTDASETGGSGTGGSGTGTPPGSRKPAGDQSKSIGTRLGEQAKATQAKSSYFSD